MLSHGSALPGSAVLDLLDFLFVAPAEKGTQLVVDGIDKEEDDIETNADGARENGNPLVDGIRICVGLESTDPDGDAKGQGGTNLNDSQQIEQDLDEGRVFRLPPEKEGMENTVGSGPGEKGKESDKVGRDGIFRIFRGDLEVDCAHKAGVGKNVDGGSKEVDELHKDVRTDSLLVDLNLDVSGNGDHGNEDARGGRKCKNLTVWFILAHDKGHGVGADGCVVDLGQFLVVLASVDFSFLQFTLVKHHKKSQESKRDGAGDDGQKEDHNVNQATADGRKASTDAITTALAALLTAPVAWAEAPSTIVGMNDKATIRSRAAAVDAAVEEWVSLGASAAAIGAVLGRFFLAKRPHGIQVSVFRVVRL